MTNSGRLCVRHLLFARRFAYRRQQGSRTEKRPKHLSAHRLQTSLKLKIIRHTHPGATASRVQVRTNRNTVSVESIITSVQAQKPISPSPPSLPVHAAASPCCRTPLRFLPHPPPPLPPTAPEPCLSSHLRAYDACVHHPPRVANSARSVCDTRPPFISSPCAAFTPAHWRRPSRSLSVSACASPPLSCALVRPPRRSGCGTLSHPLLASSCPNRPNVVPLLQARSPRPSDTRFANPKGCASSRRCDTAPHKHTTLPFRCLSGTACAAEVPCHAPCAPVVVRMGPAPSTLRRPRPCHAMPGWPRADTARFDPPRTVRADAAQQGVQTARLTDEEADGHAALRSRLPQRRAQRLVHASFASRVRDRPCSCRATLTVSARQPRRGVASVQRCLSATGPDAR
ncbi:hypothetical protein TRVL_03399 [Trypanosoma vivax]|nr:hypothetical protein TRVL_03399 [Trypanosoma vivax]